MSFRDLLHRNPQIRAVFHAEHATAALALEHEFPVLEREILLRAEVDAEAAPLAKPSIDGHPELFLHIGGVMVFAPGLAVNRFEGAGWSRISEYCGGRQLRQGCSGQARLCCAASSGRDSSDKLPPIETNLR